MYCRESGDQLHTLGGVKGEEVSGRECTVESLGSSCRTGGVGVQSPPSANAWGAAGPPIKKAGSC